MSNNESVTSGWKVFQYVLGTITLLVLGRIVVAGILPAIFPEFAELGGQGWVVNAIGAVFVLGLWSLYNHRGIPPDENDKPRDLHKKIYSMSIDVMPMLGLLGTVLGLMRFLPAWVEGQPDVSAAKYAFLTTGAGIILSAILNLMDGITKEEP